MDPRLSVVQLGPSGNTPVFRCPYHAWTYDLSGQLISLPNAMPDYFNKAENGLRPCHVKTAGGFIFINLSRQDPPDFETFIGNWREVCQEYGTDQLKIVARRQYPTKANWKLVVENFLECYHCGPSHTKSYFKVHAFHTEFVSYYMTPEQRARAEQELSRHGHPVTLNVYQQRAPQGRDALVPGRKPRAPEEWEACGREATSNSASLPAASMGNRWRRSCQREKSGHTGPERSRRVSRRPISSSTTTT